MSTITKAEVEAILARIHQANEKGGVGITREEGERLARIALASLEAEAVAWDYELASCITCEGPNGFKRVIEHEYPPEWAIEEGRARNIVPLYAAPPAPVFVPDLKGLDEFIFNLVSAMASEELSHNEKELFRIASKYISYARERFSSAMLQGAENAGSPTTMKAAPILDSSPKIAESPSGNSPVIPDGLRLALSNAGIAAPESDEMLAATSEKYIQELVTWVKDRKPFRSAVIPDGWVMVPIDMAPEMMRAVQLNSELGAYATANLSGAYSLFREFWDVAVAAAPQQEVK